MSSHYLEGLGVEIGRGQEPSTAEILYALACTLDERLGQIHDVFVRVQMSLEDVLAELRHTRAALAPAGPEPIGPPEDLEPDIDDEDRS